MRASDSTNALAGVALWGANPCKAPVSTSLDAGEAADGLLAEPKGPESVGGWYPGSRVARVVMLEAFDRVGGYRIMWAPGI